MNVISKKTLKIISVIVLLLAFTFSSNVNASTTSGKWWKWKKENRRKNKKTDSVPLDGGLGILLLGAAAFGVKKLRENNNDKA